MLNLAWSDNTISGGFLDLLRISAKRIASTTIRRNQYSYLKAMHRRILYTAKAEPYFQTFFDLLY